MGIIGPRGPSGKRGTQGSKGERGESGNEGENGPTGPKGTDGLPGKIGQPGDRADFGLPGKDGPNGAPGTIGEKGMPGTAGAQGAPGPQGSKGMQGSRGYRGSHGQFGNDGPMGATGDPGLPGKQGHKGYSGEPGGVGETGPEGRKGDRGDAGVQGPVGNPGPKGVFGDLGIQGPMGKLGTPGPDGVNGAQGPSGFPGIDGPQGPQGSIGNKGDPGALGQEGPQGAPGNAGLPGPEVDVADLISRQFYNYRDSSPSDPLAQSQPQSNSKSSSRSLYRSLLVQRDEDNSEPLQTSSEDTTIYDVLKTELESFVKCRRPLVAKRHAARTCRDLKQLESNVRNGYYWIDPNEGPTYDAVRVYCDFAINATCIYPNKTKTGNKKWFSGPDGYKWFAMEFDKSLQFVYDCDPLQLKFLRLRSDIAKQSITYHCLNSTAWFNQEYGNYKHSIKLKGDNGIEMHAEGTRKYTPNIVMDECKIKDGMWRKTVLEVNTSKTHRLPINDVAVYDVGDTGEEFGLEIGPVCFY